MADKCRICAENPHKYKCPRCLIKYCSVSCFKMHKESNCSPVLKEEKLKQVQPEQGDCVNEVRPLYETDADCSEDQVSKERLVKLGKSQELMVLLENPHLQELLVCLDKSDKPHLDMEKAMQEPLFTEFSNACLRIVEPEKYQSDAISL